MKKLFMILGTLAVLAVFVGCSNSSNSLSNANGSFTVKEIECIADESQRLWAIANNCPKNVVEQAICFILDVKIRLKKCFLMVKLSAMPINLIG